MDTDPRHGSREVKPGTHMLVALILAVSIGVALTLVYAGLSAALVIPILLALSAMGVALEVLYFMQLKISTTVTMIFFGMGTALAILFVVSLRILVPR